MTCERKDNEGTVYIVKEKDLYLSASDAFDDYAEYTLDTKLISSHEKLERGVQEKYNAISEIFKKYR